MDDLTRERYPAGVPWDERPSRLTKAQMRRRRDLIAAMGDTPDAIDQRRRDLLDALDCRIGRRR